jgi:protein ImuB
LATQDPRRGRLVAAANATARQRGIVPGMTLSQVSAICPDVRCEEHDPTADLEGLLGLSELLQQFSPIVGMESLDSKLWAGRSLHQPQSIAVDATGLAAWFGGERELGRAIQRWLAERHVFGCIGIGGSLAEAWAISNYAFRKRVASAMQSHESGDHSLQSGCHSIQIDAPECDWVEVRDETHSPADFFAEYPVEALRLELELVAKLHRLGIKSVGSLLRLPRASLTSRFGERLLDRIDQLVHSKEQAIAAWHAGEPLQGEIECEHPILSREALEPMIEQATAAMCRALESRGSGALRVLCRIGLERQSISVGALPSGGTGQTLAHVMQLSLFQATRDPAHIAWLMLGQLERCPPRVGKEIGVRSVRMEATVVAPVRWQQNELFDANQPRYREDVARLVDALSARLGRSNVITPSIVRDPLPEMQVRMRPLTGMRKDGHAQDTRRKLAKSPKRDFADERSLETRADAFLSRPTRLLESPLPIVVKLGTDGALEWVECQGMQWRVTQSCGPERIESGWWLGPTQRRDYYRIVLETGDWWWIYRDIRGGQWALHGSMD